LVDYVQKNFGCLTPGARLKKRFDFTKAKSIQKQILD